MQEIRSPNPPVVTGICDPNKFRARHHRRNHLWFYYSYNDSIGRSTMTNWNLCFICQRSTNEVLRSSNDGLATNTPKFDKLERLKFDFSQIANRNENLLSILKANNAKYHNSCQSRYRESKCKGFKLSNEKQELLRRKTRIKFLKNEVVVQQKSQGLLM